MNNRQNHHPNRCCTYPQGEASLLPLLITFMGFVATLLAFPIFHGMSGGSVRGGSSSGGGGEDHKNNFMCYQLLIDNDKLSGKPTICVPLYLTYTFFYTNYIEREPSFIHYTDEDKENMPFYIHETKWGYMMQAAAICGILSCLLGAVAVTILKTASCFHLSPRRIKKVIILQVKSFVLILASIVCGFFVNPCTVVHGRYTCKVENRRLETGACSMIVAAGLYLIAIYFTKQFHTQEQYIDNEQQHIAKTAENTTEVVPLTTTTSVMNMNQNNNAATKDTATPNADGSDAATDVE